MKKILFKSADIEKEILVGEVGELVYALCKNVDEVNDAIRWCNAHKTGEVFNSELYTMEILNDK